MTEGVNQRVGFYEGNEENGGTPSAPRRNGPPRTAAPTGELPQSPPPAATAPSKREPWGCAYRSNGVSEERAAEGGGPYGVVYRYMRGSGRSPLRHGFAVPPLPKGEASRLAGGTDYPLRKQLGLPALPTWLPKRGSCLAKGQTERAPTKPLPSPG